MYNGVGLATARGSGTNGFVQRNFALVRSGHQKVDYKSEEEIKKAEAALSRAPNQEILAHERKRQVEIKCFEMREHLEEQGHSEEEITRKVTAFRKMLMEKEGVSDKDDDSSLEKSNLSETHQLAAAKEKQNQKLREAFGISDNYVSGSSFDPALKAKEAEAKAMQQKKYSILPEPDEPSSTEKKKKKKREGSRSESESPERKHKKKRKKSHKKHKRSGRSRHRRHKRSRAKGDKKSSKQSKDDVATENQTKEGDKSENESGVESAGSSPDKHRSSRKKHKKRRKHSHSPDSDKSDASRSPSPHRDDKKSRRHSRSRSRSKSRSPEYRRHHSRSRSHSSRRRSRSRSLTYSPADRRRSASRSRSPRSTRERKKSFSPIRKRRDSPSFLDRRRITSARKLPIPYNRQITNSGFSSDESEMSASSRSRSRSESRSRRGSRSDSGSVYK